MADTKHTQISFLFASCLPGYCYREGSASKKGVQYLDPTRPHRIYCTALYDKCTSLGVDYVFIIILLLLYLVSESVELGQNDNKHMFVLLVLIYNMYILVLFKLKP